MAWVMIRVFSRLALAARRNKTWKKAIIAVSHQIYLNACFRLLSE